MLMETLLPAPPEPPHDFHIPVMGTGFTIDTPLKVARYGIASVVSLVDDVLVEQMRRFHCQAAGETYQDIPASIEDHRAQRITAYLNLLDLLVQRQSQALRQSPFQPDSEITRYYELLPPGNRKALYAAMLANDDPQTKEKQQAQLRAWATPGAIDVNIMTKLDRDRYRHGHKEAPEYSDAMSALRGFARSTLSSAVVFSAGLNARLYSYAAHFGDFLPDALGRIKKKIILKVSDFRSAAIQGRFLAKRGLWVSEFRIESGLNCGGHAFATQGHLLGPILEEFRRERRALANELKDICAKSLADHGHFAFDPLASFRVTVQGGICSAAEHEMLKNVYGVDATGWGTPFLLVPEATNVDEAHLQKLVAASPADVELSDHSPLGVPFWILRNSASEAARQDRIRQGHPGTDCPKGFLALNTEFTRLPICPASFAYQRLKLQEIDRSAQEESDKSHERETVTHKTCICHDLAGSVTVKYGIDPQATTSVCCGPSIVYFKRLATLKQMVDHIYGRASLLGPEYRPHMFLKELGLYIDYLEKEYARHPLGPRAENYLRVFRANLLSGVTYYESLAERLCETKDRFLSDLQSHRQRLESLLSTPTFSAYIG